MGFSKLLSFSFHRGSVNECHKCSGSTFTVASLHFHCTLTIYSTYIFTVQNLQLCIQYRPNQGHLKPGPWPNGYPDKIYKPRILASLPNCKNNNRFCINITKYVNFLLLFCRISLRKIVDSELVNWIIIAQRHKDAVMHDCWYVF